MRYRSIAFVVNILWSFPLRRAGQVDRTHDTYRAATPPKGYRFCRAFQRNHEGLCTHAPRIYRLVLSSIARQGAARQGTARQGAARQGAARSREYGLTTRIERLEIGRGARCIPLRRAYADFRVGVG